MTESARKRLTDLKKKLDALPKADEPPPTTLQILGRSHLEDDWQQLLVHYLTPEKAHGFGNSVLEHLLDELSEKSSLGFSYSKFDIENVRVEQEVITEKGIPDVIIWSPENWFICIEAKIEASETNDQTERYVDVTEFGSIGLNKDDVPEDGHHYVYLAPEDASQPSSEEFVFVSWEWVASKLQSFLAESYGEYPARPTAQLDEFIDTVRSELTMTEYQENRQEKQELYVSHYDEIREVQEAFDEGWNDLKNEWGDRLIDYLRIPRADVPSRAPEKCVACRVNRDNDSEKWIVKQTHDDWSWILKDGWWIDLDTREYGKDVRIGFLHRLDWNRTEAVRDRELKFYFRVAPPSHDKYKDSFRAEFYDREDRVSELTPKPDEVTGNQRNLLETTYDIEVESYETFFDAYIDALGRAFDRHVASNQDLVKLLDEIHSNAVEEANRES